jgi:xylulokinase
MQNIMTAPKLMWHQEHEPDAWRKSVTFLKTADYIAWKLSGEAAQNLSLASRSGLIDLRGRDWSDELLGIANVERSFLPPVLDGGTPLGPVQPAAQAETGLSRNTLVAVGGHDHVCGALASGTVHHGDFLDSMGTSECLFVALDEPLDNLEAGRRGFTMGAHARDTYYMYGGLYTSGICFDWIRNAAAEGKPHEDLLRAAANVPPGSLGALFVPHLRLANTPHPDGQARGAFIGLTTDIGTAELTRAVLEGVALEGRDTMEYLLDFAGIPALDEVRITGGTARNELLLRIKASVMNATLRVLETEEAGALGAAMLGGIAAGVYDSVPDAVAHIKTRDHIIENDPDSVALYDRLYGDVYRNLFYALQPLNHALFRRFTGVGIAS